MKKGKSFKNWKSVLLLCLLAVTLQLGFLSIFGGPTPVVTFETNGGTAVTGHTLTNDTFVYDGQMSVPQYYRMERIVAGDLDGDLDNDLVVAGWGDPLIVYENDASALQPYVTVDSYVLSIDLKILDADQDGITDILLLKRTELSLYSHDGSYGFTETVLFDPTENIISFEVGDLNNDGDEDIVVATSGYKVYQILSDGTGGFLAAEHLVDHASYIASIEIYDADNDTINDIMFNSSNSTTPIKFLKGENDGTYDENVSNEIILYDYNTPLTYHYKFEMKDIDGDGIKDIFIFDNNTTYGYCWIKILADGSFEEDLSNEVIVNVIESTPGSNYASLLDDADGDGDLDLAIWQEYSTNSIKTYINDGSGGFSAPENRDTISITDLAYIDYNSDGNLDYIQVSYNNESIYKYQSSGSDGYILSGANTTRTGYSFGGWYTDSALTTSFSTNTIITTDITLYAKWNIQTFYVYFSGNGNDSGYTNRQLFEYGVAQDLTPNLYVKNGYDFAGWNTSSDGTGDSYANESSASFERSTNLYYLYAQWTPSNYDVVFDSNTGTGTMNNQTFGYTETENLDSNTYTKEGYVFVSWNTEANGSGDEYLDNASFTMPLNGDTLYAQWEVDTFTIEYVDYDGTVLQTADYDYNVDISGVTAPSNPTRTGYTFDAWDTTLPGTMPAGDITVTTTYTPNQYAIEFVDYEGTVLQTALYDFESDISTVVAPTDPIREGYSFNSWDTTLLGTMPSNKITVTATYTINQYVLEYVDHDGTVLQTANLDFETDLTSITAPSVPSRTGYTFSAWDISVPSTMPSNNLTITATYTVNSYTVTYDLDGNTETETVNFGANPSEVPTPVKNGYEFVEWTLNDVVTNPNTYTMGATDVTFIAVYRDAFAPVIIGVSNAEINLSDVATFTIPVATVTDNVDSGLSATATYFKADGTTSLSSLQEVIDELELLNNVIIKYNAMDTEMNEAIEVEITITVVDDIPPMVEGIEDDMTYESGSEVSVTFTEGTATLNGVEYLSGQVISEPGEYELIVTDDAGNEMIYNFIIEGSFMWLLWFIFIPVAGIGFLVYRKFIL